jgi:hypothetical protein
VTHPLHGGDTPGNRGWRLQCYIDVGLVRRVASALLAIFLWFLVLLGVDLHIKA